MTGQNGKRFALVGMLAGALLLGSTQAAAQAQSGTTGSTAGSTTGVPQSGVPNTDSPSNSGLYPNSTTPRDQTLAPPDVINQQPGTGGSGYTGDLPSSDDALRTPSTGNTTTNPNTREPSTGMQDNTATPDSTRRDTTIDPGTGGSGTAGSDNMRKDDSTLGTGGTGGSGTTGSDTLRNDNSTLRPDGLGTGNSDLNGTGNPGTTGQGTMSPDSVYKDNTGAKTR